MPSKLARKQRDSDLSDTVELLEATTALILPLLHALDALNQASRLMHLPALQEVVAAIAPYRNLLEEGRQVFTQAQWPDHLEAFLITPARRLHSRCAPLTGLPRLWIKLNRLWPHIMPWDWPPGVRRRLSVIAMLPPVNRFYLESDVREDEEPQQKLMEADPEKPNGRGDACR